MDHEMLRTFELHQPASVAEAVDYRRRFGTDGAVYAGGTELLLVMKEGLAHYEHLIDVKRVPGLDVLTYDGTRRRLVLGATVTHRRIERSREVWERFPTLESMAARVANVRVRNFGTIGGNLCFAEPHADPAALLSVYGADVVLAGSRGERRLTVDDFITGPYETALGPDKILVRIEVPAPAAWAAGTYLKFGMHERADTERCCAA
jgi:carbon-monoxide dehydrogenase medium subunit